MNKYFLLLITSFASLSLNAAEASAASGSEVNINLPLAKELTFLEKGGCVGGETIGARTTAQQEWYKLENKKTGYSYFVQNKAGGTEGYVNGTTVSVTNAHGKTVYLTSRELGYQVDRYLDLCRNNTARFSVVAATK